MPSPRATELFEELKEKSPELQEEALNRLPPEERALRDEVSTLLACQKEAGNFLERTHSSLMLELAEGIIQDPLHPGDEIEDFVIMEKIGEGGAGTVYRATQKSLQREVALKVTPDEGSEGQMMASLDHENVVRVFSEHRRLREGLRLLSMQYVRGPSLDRVISTLRKSGGRITDGKSFLATVIETGHISPEEPAWSQARYKLSSMDALELAIWITKKLAEGLKYTHGHEILHLDIKPANILLHPSGNPMLTDFSISRTKIPRPGEPEISGGTKKYMAPEQERALTARSESPSARLDARSDLFSLAVTLSELFELFQFESSGGAGLAERRMRSALKKASNPNPEARFQNVGAFIDQLGECLKLHFLEKMTSSRGSTERSRFRQPHYLVRGAIILVALGAFCLHELSSMGMLHKGWHATRLPTEASRINALFSDLKLRIRGPQGNPKFPIRIVAIDTESVTIVGRWPWRRDIVAYLMNRLHRMGAAAVGLDIVFPESEQLLPDELQHLSAQYRSKLDTDGKLADAISRWSDQIAVSWISESACQPKYSEKRECPILDSKAWNNFSESFARFSIPMTSRIEFNPEETGVPSVITTIPNLDRINESARHSGFSNLVTDKDGVLRRTSLVMMARGMPHPSLALALASILRKDDAEIAVGPNGDIRTLKWKSTNSPIPVSPLGVVPINFRGSEGTFTRISASEVLEENPSERLRGLLKDAVVLVGVTTEGLGQALPTPVDFSLPRIEIHANILDNLLAGDLLMTNVGGGAIPISTLLIAFLMSLGLWTLLNRVDALRPTQALLALTSLGILVLLVDFLLFRFGNYLLATGFLYLELGILFTVTVCERFLIEEWHKKNAQIIVLGKENELLQDELDRLHGTETRKVA